MPLDDIIQEGDDLIQNAENAFIGSVKKAEPLVFDEVIKILDTTDINLGKLKGSTASDQFLMQLNKKILTALKKSGYGNAVSGFVQQFPEVAANVKDIQKDLSSITITDAQIGPILKLEVNNTIQLLTDQGLASGVIAPVRQAIYRNIALGESRDSAEKLIREFLVSSPQKDSRLLSYTGQIATDSVYQFRGGLQQKIGDEIGANAERYVGSIISDSRGQCTRWVSENNGIILHKDLPAQISWAMKPGNVYNGHRTSGMIPGTTISNFTRNRGGYRCRHQSIPFVYRKK